MRRALALAAALSTALLAAAALTGLPSAPPPLAPSPPSRIALTFPTDLSDDAALARAADSLFHGQVTARRGQSNLGIGVESQYDVRVQQVFKGSLPGTVVVNQQGGRDEAGRVVDLPEGDALLRVGERYLFATRYSVKWGFHTVIPVYGDRPAGSAEPENSPAGG